MKILFCSVHIAAKRDWLPGMKTHAGQILTRWIARPKYNLLPVHRENIVLVAVRNDNVALHHVL